MANGGSSRFNYVSDQFIGGCWSLNLSSETEEKNMQGSTGKIE